MKERLTADCLIIQLNKRADWAGNNETAYAKAYMPSQFERTYRQVTEYMSFIPVAVWKIKEKH